MMMIAPNSRARKGGDGEVWRNLRGGGGDVDYGEMVQPSQQYVAPYLKGVEWGLGPIGLRMVATFWAGIPVEVIQEAGIV